MKCKVPRQMRTYAHLVPMVSPSGQARAMVLPPRVGVHDRANQRWHSTGQLVVDSRKHLRLPFTMAVNISPAIDREILRPLWKVHILHHASRGPIVGNWMLDELREHGYRVSPGTLYPLLGRMVRMDWLRHSSNGRYRLTAAGRRALSEVRRRLRELQGEVFEGG
jgi:PadR family transcriptional regulator, regulatory protein PadR